MRRPLLLILGLIIFSSGLFSQTTVWNPAGNAPSDGLWSTIENWTNGLPLSDAGKAVFNVPDALACVIDSEVNAYQLIQGDGETGDTIIIENGGTLTTGNNWDAIGYNSTATFIINAGGTATFGHHCFIGMQPGSMGNVHIYGTMNVTQQTGIGWKGGDAVVSIYEGGILNSTQFNAMDINNLSKDMIGIGENDLVDIRGGVWNIDGNKTAAVNTYVEQGRIVAWGGGGTLNVSFNSASNKTQITSNPDETAPTIINTIPENEETGVPALPMIDIEFSEPMNHESVENAISVNPEITNMVFTWNKTTLTLSGDEMSTLTEYTITIANTAKDGNDFAMENEYSFSFTTVDPTAPPLVVSSIPENDATGVGVNADFVINFSKEMNPASVESNGDLPGMVDISFVWSNDNKTVTISHGKLDWEKTYTISLAAGAEAADGTLMEEDASLNFTTEEQPLTDIVWQPAEDGSSDGLWMSAENWSPGEVPDGNYKVIFNHDVAVSSTLDTLVKINQLVQGSGGSGDTLIIAKGGKLTTGAIWSSVGYNDTAVMVVEEGGYVSFGEHAFIGMNENGSGQVHINGGVMNIAAQTGLGWRGGTGTVFLKKGILNMSHFNPLSGDASIKEGSSLLISPRGLATIDGNKLAAVNTYIDSGRIAATEGELLARYNQNQDETVLEVLGEQAGTTVWDPVAGVPNLWVNRFNWSDGRVPGETQKVVFNKPVPCVLNESGVVNQMVMGDNGPGDTLTITKGGVLTTGSVWSGIAYNDTAVLVLNQGAVVNFGQHLWVGFLENAKGTVIINDGTVNVAQQIGLGWRGGTGTVYVNRGRLNLTQFNPVDGDASIKEGSSIVISSHGLVALNGDKLAAVNAYIDSGRIVAREEDKTLTVRFDENLNKTFVEILSDPAATNVWDPLKGSTRMWTDRLNWSDGNVAGLNQKVVFNKGEKCVLNDSATIKQLVVGDNGNGDTLFIAEGGHLVTTSAWSAVSYNDTAVMIVEKDASVDFGSHMWISQGAKPEARGTLIIRGGIVNVGEMTGLGWRGGEGYIYISDGELNLSGFNSILAQNDASIKEGSFIEISGEGKVSKPGNEATMFSSYIKAGRIRSVEGFEVRVTYNQEDDLTLLTSVPMDLPLITENSPEDNATDVLCSELITLTFSEYMNKDSVEMAVTVVPEIVNMDFDWDGTILTLTGDPLQTGTEYTVTVGNPAMDINGNALSGEFRFSFTTSDVVEGIGKQNAEYSLVYPNPATTVVYLNGKSFEDVIIYSLSGKLQIHKKNVSQVNIQELDPGQYILKAVKGNKSFIQKLVVN